MAHLLTCITVHHWEEGHVYTYSFAMNKNFLATIYGLYGYMNNTFKPLQEIIFGVNEFKTTIVTTSIGTTSTILSTTTTSISPATAPESPDSRI